MAGTPKDDVKKVLNHLLTTAKNAAQKTKQADQDGKGRVIHDTYITKTADRGKLAGYEQTSAVATPVTVDGASADDVTVTGAVVISVPNGTASQTYQKNVGITNAGATISPGGQWKWVGGKAPEVKANSMLVCKWLGSFGILSLVLTE